MMKLVNDKLGAGAASDIEAIVTVPAYFNARQKEATFRAAEMAGLNIKRVLSEPTAAALSALYQLPPRDERIMVVYDFGGGTLDVTVMSAGDDCIPNVEGCRGNMDLGGRDFDERLIDLVIKKFLN